MSIFMDILGFFDQHPVFTSNELVRFLVSLGSTNPHTQRESLAYHIKKGHVARIRRGYFASIPMAYWNSPDSYPVDPFLIASHVTNDAVLAYHTALDLHGVSYSTYHEFSFMSQQNIRPFTYQASFTCLPFPKKLSDQNQIHFEVETINRQGLNISVTSLERTIVDILDRPNYTGGWEEIWQSAAHFPILKLDKIISYAFILDNATTIAKLGFFLEQQKDFLSVDEQTLTILQKKIPESIHYLERSKRQPGKLIKRWNLVIPESIVGHSWEEPNNDFI